jgi:hypothetical protein
MAEGNDDGSHDDAAPDRAGHLVKYRWRAGQSGNPGGSSHKQRDLNAAVRDTQTPERVRMVMEALFIRATRGFDVAAAKVYLDRVVGPVTPEDVDLSEAPTEVLEWLAALGKRRN